MAPLRTTLPKATERRRLGGALDVSPFCLGHVKDPRAIPAAFDAGINFFFVSADMHWPYYEAARQGLRDLLARGGGIRDRIVVAAVSYVTQPEFCHQPFLEVLESLPGLKTLDVTLAGATREHDFEARAREYAQHKDFGVRAFGATFHDRRFAAQTIASRAVQIGFVRYNPRHRGAETELFPHLEGRAPTLVYNFNTTQGVTRKEYDGFGFPPSYWRPGPTDYYRFALARPELDGMLCALETPEQVRSLVDALAQGPLAEEENRFVCDIAELANGEAVLEEEASQ